MGLLLSEAQLEEVLRAQDQEEQEVRECLEAQGCQEVPECQEEDTATQDVSASICPATWEVLECPQCHRSGPDQELDLVDLVPHLFLPRVETEQVGNFKFLCCSSSSFFCPFTQTTSLLPPHHTKSGQVRKVTKL